MIFFKFLFQVVTLAVYSYFVTSVMGRQWLETSPDGEAIGGAAKHRSKIDLYFPFFLTLQVNKLTFIFLCVPLSVEPGIEYISFYSF